MDPFDGYFRCLLKLVLPWWRITTVVTSVLDRSVIYFTTRRYCSSLWLYFQRCIIAQQKTQQLAFQGDSHRAHHSCRDWCVRVRLDPVLRVFSSRSLRQKARHKLESGVSCYEVASVLEFGCKPNYLHFWQPGLSQDLSQTIALFEEAETPTGLQALGSNSDWFSPWIQDRKHNIKVLVCVTKRRRAKEAMGEASGQRSLRVAEVRGTGRVSFLQLVAQSGT